MTPLFKKKITKVRSDFESKSVDLDLLARLYREYADVDEVDIFIKRALAMFPNLNCGVASVYLKYLFPELNIVRGRFNKATHTFCLKNKDIVVDLTADQFGGPKVYVGKIKKPWSVLSFVGFKVMSGHCVAEL